VLRCFFRLALQVVEADAKRWRAEKTSLSVMDVDGFKRINDTSDAKRNPDPKASVFEAMGRRRVVIVLPETLLKGAILAAERIQNEIREREFA